MPESLRRTLEIEKAKEQHNSGRERIQAPERPQRTDEIEKGKRDKPGSL
jgi:hypothetical protein